MSKPTPTFYIFHGDDDLRIDEEVEKMRARMGSGSEADLNTAEYDGQAVDAAEVISAASAYPFLFDKRLIIVKGMLAWITRKGAGETGKRNVERLASDLPRLPEWARVVFCERAKVPDTHKVIKAARESENGYEKLFEVPRDATAWIIKRAADQYGAEIEAPAAAALASVIAGDLRRADNELLKLAAYVDGARPIRESDVALLTPYVSEANVFQMADAIAEGRGGAALQAYGKLIDQGEEPLMIYGMIVRQFRLLLLAKEHLAAGGYTNTLAEALNTRSGYGLDKVARQSRAFELDQLERIYRILQDYDRQMKTGAITPDLALPLLIGSLTR